MRDRMRAPWSKKTPPEKKPLIRKFPFTRAVAAALAAAPLRETEAERRAVRSMLEERFSSLSTSVFLSTSTYVGTSASPQMLSVDRARSVTERASTQSTLEPILTDDLPSLRPARQFE